MWGVVFIFKEDRVTQGYNARKVISVVYRSFAYKKNQLIILVIGNYYVNYQHFQNAMLLSTFLALQPWGGAQRMRLKSLHLTI